MNYKPGAVLKSDCRGYQDSRTRSFGEFPGQRHGIGWTSEKIRPDAFSLCGYLVWKNADRFTALERFQQQAYAAEIRGRQPDFVSPASRLDQWLQLSYFGWPIEHGDRPPLRRP